MKNSNTNTQQITSRTLRSACVAALGTVFLLALPHMSHADQAARAKDVIPPAVPGDLQVETPNVPFLLGHAFGTQNYVCLPSGAAFAWTLFTPQATLFDEDFEQLTTHFFGPNPDEVGIVIRAAWQHRDTSTVWGRVKAFSFDSNFVAPGAIPWLLVETKGTEAGPAGGDRLTKTTFIHRVNTVGGAAPPTGCSVSTDIGRSAFVPYAADYVFYKNPTR